MTRGEVRILFTSAGRRVELARCFRRAAAALGLDAHVHACDFVPDFSAACLDADLAFAVPRCTDPAYVDRLIAHCAEHRIDLLVPTIDTELDVLAQARDRFADIGTRIHVSDTETIAIVRDKQRTVAVLADAGVPVPRTAPVEDVRATPGDWRWPAFVKPVGGSASRGIGVLEGPEDIAGTYPEPMLVQELLRGAEYTVNMYVDADGRMLSAIPHRRISVRGGEVEKGCTVRDPRFIAIAAGVAAALPGARGVLCFQLIDDPVHGPCVFEINARFGGGYPLADHAGARFAESLLASLTGRPECASPDWREDVTMVRYDAAVFRG